MDDLILMAKSKFRKVTSFVDVKYDSALVSAKYEFEQAVSVTKSEFNRTIARPGITPYPCLFISGLSLLNVRRPFGLFGPIGLIGTSAAFAVSAYSTSLDIENGPATATAWAVIYITTLSKAAVETKRFMPIFLTGAVFFNGVLSLVEMLDFIF